VALLRLRGQRSKSTGLTKRIDRHTVSHVRMGVFLKLKEWPHMMSTVGAVHTIRYATIIS